MANLTKYPLQLFSINQICASLLFVVFIAFVGFSQKQIPFVGVLEYKMSARDTSLTNFLPNNSMFIYSNDTIVRTENYTKSLGLQVSIKHMEKNKSYLLLITDYGKFAIQTDLSKEDSLKKESKYSFKKKFFKQKIAGFKANKMLVSHPDFEEPIEFLYLKNRSNKYNQIFEEIPGLLVRYSIPTPDGILDYELVKMMEYKPNHDLFGIPSDFEKISFNDFIDKMIKAKSEEEKSGN